MALQSGTAAAGCQRLVDWKARLHGSPTPPALANLTVEVEPRQGITVQLDGSRVAQESPYATAELPTGSHVLEVRAMGYYPVTLPFVADANHPLHLPVRLRARPPLAFGPADPPKAPPGTPDAPRPGPGEGGAEFARRPAAGAKAAPLPGQTRPLHLSIEARPAAAIVVDGVAADADSVRLLQGEGKLAIGDMALSYRVRPGRGLELNIPHEAGRDIGWYVGGLQVKAKSLVRLSATPIVLRRVQAGRALEATVRRLD